MMKKKNKPALNWVAITGGAMGKSAGKVESTSRTTSLTTHWGKGLIQNLHQSTDSRSAGKVNNWQHWQKCKLKYIQYFQVYSSGGVSQTVCLYAWWQWRWQVGKPQPNSVPGGRQQDSQAFFGFTFCLLEGRKATKWIQRGPQNCACFSGHTQKRSLSGPTNYFKVREDLLEHLCSPLRSFVRKKNLNHLLILINHPRIMSDHSYDILLKRGRCLLSCSDDKDKNKDKMLKTPNICYIFEKYRIQGPDRTGPDRTGPDRTGPDQIRPDFPVHSRELF